MALNGLINNEASAPAAIYSREPPAKSSTTAAIDHAPFGFPGDCVIFTQPELRSNVNANRTGNHFSAIRTLQPNSRFTRSAGLPPFRAMEPDRSSTCLPALESQQARGRRMNTWTG